MRTLLPIPAEDDAPVRSRRRDLLLVLGAAWAARAAFILIVPARAHSDDVTSWITVAHQLRAGANPYVTTTLLNWPPLWLSCIWLIDHVSRALGISFFLGLRLFLIAVESVLIVLVYAFLARVAPRRAWLIVLVGISLNPVAILLVCQHANFDVIVGLCCFAGVVALTAAARNRDVVAWLAAALALGLGVLAKTTPLILAPLLARGARTASGLGRGLGAALFLGPALLGLGVIYVLAPHAVTENVIRYRSSGGYFGFTGLIDGFGPARFSTYYSRDVFPVLALAWIAAAGAYLWRRDLEERRTVLLAALVLFAVPAVGPGYATQYAYWWLPLLVATFPLFDRGWRKVLLCFYVICAAEYIAEYALFSSHGAFLDAFFPSNGFLQRVAHHSGDPKWQTVFRLPFFAASLALLVAGLLRLRPRLD